MRKNLKISKENGLRSTSNLTLALLSIRKHKMPISPSYTWDETELALEVVVSLPGASRAKSDVFATECMLKVNSSPYLLLIDLYDEVDDSRSAATLTGDGVVFKLFKVGLINTNTNTNMHTHTHTHAHTHAHNHANIHLQRHTRTHTCTHNYTHSCTHTLATAHAHTHTHMHTHNLHKTMHTYTCNHTRAHTLTQRPRLWVQWQ
jgi:hypothetical protein